MSAPKKSARYDDRQRITDYKALFNSGLGQRVLNDMLVRHWFFNSTLHTDPAIMAHREGERNVMLYILRYLEMKPADLAEVRQSLQEQFGLDVAEE